MHKLFLTMALAFLTTIASAQFSVITTIQKIEGIEAVEPSATEVYEGDVCPTTETEDSWNVWKGLSIDPNYTMPAKADEAGEREGTFNLSISYKL